MKTPADRIIPARAGFTRPRIHLGDAGADHPRSRGVYWPLSGGAARPCGSSPLARGLLNQGEGFKYRSRIIPARAGFTPRRGNSIPRGRDHPRSRGVYPASPMRRGTTRGSSPLARGLHAAALDNMDRDGIIPARAGFTSSRTGTTPTCLDHPRSRGVYLVQDRDDANLFGSSPLARGLPAGRGHGPVAARIIPARAGFTAWRASWRPSRQDHPRSRGVYVDDGRPLSPGQGSSPLARGLPAETTDAISPIEDHPRSRGVYSDLVPMPRV